MHQVLKAFPCSFDGINVENLKIGDRRDFGSMAEGLKKAGYIGEIAPGLKASVDVAGGYIPAAGGKSAALREDGPTIAEYIAAGYLASNYPPQGYAPRSTPEEIAAAVAEEAAKSGGGDAAAWEAMKADLAKQTVAQLRGIVAAEQIELAAEDNKKDEIIAKIVAARQAKAASDAAA